MVPRSPGRTPKWTPAEIKQAWKNLRAENPTASKTDLAKLLNMSTSRIRAILNNHPSELRRKEEKTKTEPAQANVSVVKQDSERPKKQMLFFPDGWNGF